MRNVGSKLTVGMLTLVALFLVIGSQRGAHAQEPTALQIRAGETLEITTDAASADAQFSWILTKDRKFLSGQRTRFFQTRLTEAGIYTLDVSIQSQSTGENALRTFSVIVSEPDTIQLPDETDRTGLPLKAGVIVEPTAVNGVIYLPPHGGMIRIDASKSEGKIEHYSVDLDSTLDTQVDGDPTNDIDNAETLSEKTGSAFYLFALPKQAPRSIKVSVSDLSQTTPSSIELPVSFTGIPVAASQSSVSVQSNGPISLKIDELTITAEAKSVSTLEGRQILYEWDFGDRSRSLLARPTHTYLAPGTYVVSLTARDITTGEVVESVSTSVAVLSSTSEGNSSESNVSSSASSSIAVSTSSAVESGNESDSSSFSLWSSLKVLLIIILLLSLALGLYALLTWIKKRTTTSLQQTLEKMEETIVKKDPKEMVIDAATPMKLKKEGNEISLKNNADKVVDREKTKSDFRNDRSLETPVASSGPVPPWLSNPGTGTKESKPGSVQPVKNESAATPTATANDITKTPSWLVPQNKSTETTLQKDRLQTAQNNGVQKPVPASTEKNTTTPKQEAPASATGQNPMRVKNPQEKAVIPTAPEKSAIKQPISENNTAGPEKKNAPTPQPAQNRSTVIQNEINKNKAPEPPKIAENKSPNPKPSAAPITGVEKSTSITPSPEKKIQLNQPLKSVQTATEQKQQQAKTTPMQVSEKIKKAEVDTVISPNAQVKQGATQNLKNSGDTSAKIVVSEPPQKKISPHVSLGNTGDIPRVSPDSINRAQGFDEGSTLPIAIIQADSLSQEKKQQP